MKHDLDIILSLVRKIFRHKKGIRAPIPDASEGRGHYVAASGAAAVLSPKKRAWRVGGGGLLRALPSAVVEVAAAAVVVPVAVLLVAVAAVVDFDGLVARWIIIILARLLCSHWNLEMVTNSPILHYTLRR